jgi:hypothetical protein
MEIPGALNSWMGGHFEREFHFRLTVVGMGLATAYGSYHATRYLTDPMWDRLWEWMPE